MKPIRVTSIQDLDSSTEAVDLFIGAFGYESRARAVAVRRREINESRLIADLMDGGTPAYERNKAFFQSEISAKIVQPDEFLAAIRVELNSLVSHRTDIRVGLDISSVKRKLLAQVLELILAFAETTTISLRVFYSLATFTQPPEEQPVNTLVGPITPRFSGWPTSPELPPAAIVGLGYEEGKAAGAVEYLEALPNVWALLPNSSELAYKPEVMRQNGSLLQALPIERQINYEVGAPTMLFSILETLISGLKQKHNVIVLPFGPKLFLAIAILVTQRHPEAAVWYVSGEKEENSPVDREDASHFLGFKCTLGATGLFDKSSDRRM